MTKASKCRAFQDGQKPRWASVQEAILGSARAVAWAVVHTHIYESTNALRHAIKAALVGQQRGWRDCSDMRKGKMLAEIKWTLSNEPKFRSLLTPQAFEISQSRPSDGTGAVAPQPSASRPAVNISQTRSGAGIQCEGGTASAPLTPGLRGVKRPAVDSPDAPASPQTRPRIDSAAWMEGTLCKLESDDDLKDNAFKLFRDIDRD